MEKNVIIMQYKGGNKQKDNQDSYRAITLSFIQLFDNIEPPTRPLQGKGCGRGRGVRKFRIASFMLRKSFNFTKENNSKLY